MVFNSDAFFFSLAVKLCARKIRWLIWKHWKSDICEWIIFRITSRIIMIFSIVPIVMLDIIWIEHFVNTDFTRNIHTNRKNNIFNWLWPIQRLCVFLFWVSLSSEGEYIRLSCWFWLINIYRNVKIGNLLSAENKLNFYWGHEPFFSPSTFRTVILFQCSGFTRFRWNQNIFSVLIWNCRTSCVSYIVHLYGLKECNGIAGFMRTVERISFELCSWAALSMVWH